MFPFMHRLLEEEEYGFRYGDYVRVILGFYKGQKGKVIDVFKVIVDKDESGIIYEILLECGKTIEEGAIKLEDW